MGRLQERRSPSGRKARNRADSRSRSRRCRPAPRGGIGELPRRRAAARKSRKPPGHSTRRDLNGKSAALQDELRAVLTTVAVSMHWGHAVARAPLALTTQQVADLLGVSRRIHRAGLRSPPGAATPESSALLQSIRSRIDAHT